MVAVGSIVAGKVAKVANYGAFVDLEGGGSGMVHISQVANTYVKDINDYLKVGDAVTVKVIAITPDNKVSLSIKDAMSPEAAAPMASQGQRGGSRPPRSFAPRSYNKPAAIPSTGDNFEDMLNRYKKSSDDRMSDLKKVIDPRRGAANRRAHSK